MRNNPYFRVVWPGIGFDYKVLNVDHPNRVPTMNGGDFDVSKGGPRLLLLQSHCIEKELVRVILSKRKNKIQGEIKYKAENGRKTK